MVRVTGSCHPTGKPDDYDGFYLTKKEIAKKSHELVGIPVLLEHDNKTQVGKIIGAHVEPKTGRLIVDMDIGTDTLEGNRTLRRLREGDLAGLSLGIDLLIADHPEWSKVVGKNIFEVSMTTDPALDDTNIMYVEPKSEKTLLARKHIELGMEVDRLKKGLYKKQTALFQVLRPGEELPDSESIQADQSISSLLRTVDSMSVQNTAQQPPAQQAPPPETQSTPQQPLVSPEELQKKITENQESKRLLDEKISKFETLEKNPELFEKWFDEQKKTSQAKRKIVEDEYEDLCSFAAESFTKTGMTDDADFVENYRFCAQDKPDAAYAMTTALASCKKRSKNEEELHFKAQDALYQENKRIKEENAKATEEWKRRFDDSNTFHVSEMKRLEDVITMKNSIIGFPTQSSPSLSVAPATTPSFQDRWAPPRAAAAAPATAAPTQETGQAPASEPPDVPYSRPRYQGPSLGKTPDPMQQEMFLRFKNSMRNTPAGMDVVNYKGIVDKQYRSGGVDALGNAQNA